MLIFNIYFKERTVVILKKEKLYLRKDAFELEIKAHKGQKHPTKFYKGHHARLDKKCDIASMIGVSQPTLCNWLNGSNNITEVNLIALADLFGCDWEYLCGKQAMRSRIGYMQETIKKIADDYNDAIENDKEWFDPIAFEDEKTITCNRYPVDKLIKDIVQLGGYQLIIDGLREISEFIKID